MLCTSQLYSRDQLKKHIHSIFCSSYVKQSNTYIAPALLCISIQTIMLNFIGGRGYNLGDCHTILTLFQVPTIQPPPHTMQTHTLIIQISIITASSSHYSTQFPSLLSHEPKLIHYLVFTRRLLSQLALSSHFKLKHLIFFFSYSFSQNLPRLIRITLLKERRGSVQSNCSREKQQRGGRLQDESVSLKQFHRDWKSVTGRFPSTCQSQKPVPSGFEHCVRPCSCLFFLLVASPPLPPPISLLLQCISYLRENKQAMSFLYYLPRSPLLKP